MLRDGSRDASVRFRAHDSREDMLFGPDLITTELAAVLLGTFAD